MLDACFANHHSLVHILTYPRCFQSTDEFRKIADQFYPSKFKILQEIVSNNSVQSFDIWKKCITNESVGVRPNYGRVHKMLKFGASMWIWETNAVPVMQKCTEDCNPSDYDHVGRRVLTIKLRGDFTPDPTLSESLSSTSQINQYPK